MKAEAGLALGEDADEGANRGRNRCVTVGEERVCGLCHKRLGGSVISVYPEWVVLFHVCFLPLAVE